MAYRTWITMTSPTPLIFRYHLPLTRMSQIDESIMKKNTHTHGDGREGRKGSSDVSIPCIENCLALPSTQGAAPEYPTHPPWPQHAFYTVIRSCRVSAKFSTCTVMSVNGTLDEDKMRRFKGECAHFSFNKCPIYTHDGASVKFSTNSNKTDNSV